MNRLALCGHMDVAQTQITVAVHEVVKQTRPPLSEMDSSRIKCVHDRTKDRVNVQLRLGLERFLSGFHHDFNP